LAFILVFALSGCSLLKLKPKADSANESGVVSISGKLREKASPRKEATNIAVQTTSPSATSPQAQPAIQPAALVASNSFRAVTPYRMRPNDPVVIFLRDLPGKESEQQLQDIIDDAGTVNLPLIGRLVAAGKTSSEFEQEIEKKYIDGKIYLRITVNVVTPQQFIFVSGEVKLPNRYQLLSGMTLLPAIATAGGFTDYADRTEVQLIRGGKVTSYNARELEKRPEKDVALEPSDQIVVKRSAF
jgi:polysaccharide export outer membrane protein